MADDVTATPPPPPPAPPKPNTMRNIAISVAAFLFLCVVLSIWSGGNRGSAMPTAAVVAQPTGTTQAVAAIQPTATSAPAPTAAPTVNIQGTIEAAVKATEAARPTAPPTVAAIAPSVTPLPVPTAAPTVAVAVKPGLSSEEQAYQRAILDQSSQMSRSLRRVGELFQAARPSDRAWLAEVRTNMRLWERLYGETKKLNPPERFQPMHEKWEAAMAEFDVVAHEVSWALDNQTHPDAATRLTHGVERMQRGNALLTEATALAPRD